MNKNHAILIGVIDRDMKCGAHVTEINQAAPYPYCIQEKPGTEAMPELGLGNNMILSYIMISNGHDNCIVVIFTAQLAGKARQLGCPKIVLDHVRVLYIYIYICLCALGFLTIGCIRCY